jgi:hypothetical protein
MIGGPEAGVILLTVLLLLGVPVGVGALLTLWAFRVARTQATVGYRRLRWLPLGAAVLWVATLGSGIAFALRLFAAAARSAPEEKARLLAEGISETANWSTLVALIVSLCFIASGVASATAPRK